MNRDFIDSGWTDEDWTQSIVYMGIDLAVELVVFGGTIFVLHQIYPQFKASRILRGLLAMHSVEMIILSWVAWGFGLLCQSTYTGMDMSLSFSWIKCRNEANSTWLGGFKWEC